ncbi:putative glyoxalase superfamily metalloenzyme YdcJ [Bradyrhizobium sp. USDA 326]|uniref:2-oxoadipate dioxygenase/decarboxylase HglS n=1 Tax=unclassified Bradyrhizobium TaxID=2631580 RepID=UPI003519D1AD
MTDMLPADEIRTLFSRAMSNMYRAEVPQYGALIELVSDVNAQIRSDNAGLDRRLHANGETERLSLERHGAIRLGTPEELATIRRLFRVMDMHPVGYYDLSVAGVPVHATAFRPIELEALRRNPFRVFTSLLRLDLIPDVALREEAAAILARRKIFSPRCLELIEHAEREGGLQAASAQAFVLEALNTFCWHSESMVSSGTYKRLRAAHPLIADVVCFKGPHINHLTPRTLDIDAVQDRMVEFGMSPKAVVEGPPRRNVPILLRQTSFKALEEKIGFRSTSDDDTEAGVHSARFGEVEQRGVALTPKGRLLYDQLLRRVREAVQIGADGTHADAYQSALADRFQEFPDDEDSLRKEGLAFFRYVPTGKAGSSEGLGLDELVSNGHVRAEPITYEDFLPVSAAGIFQSNLGDESQQNYAERSAKSAFEQALNAIVADEIALYRAAEEDSIAECMRNRA